MKNEFRLFAVLAGFFVLVTVVYAFWSQLDEPVGVVALTLSALLCAMVAYYVWFTGRKMDLRPEDDEHGDIAQFQGDFGFFSPYSWWPLFVGACAAFCFAGLAVGWWMFIIGATFGVVALVGWTFEYFKGEHAL